jgi:hypothetical protein
MKTQFRWFILLAGIFITTCSRVPELPPLVVQETSPVVDAPETETPVSDSADEPEREERISLEDLDFDAVSYLSAFFPKDYTLLSKPVRAAGQRFIWFAVNYIDEDSEVSDTAVGFEVLDGEAQRHLLVKNFKFIRKDDSVLIDFSPRLYPGIYGFNFQTNGNGIGVTGFYDGGLRMDDGFFIEWDEEKGQFKLYVHQF